MIKPEEELQAELEGLQSMLKADPTSDQADVWRERIEEITAKLAEISSTINRGGAT